jgi:salicylate hydroxylase
VADEKRKLTIEEMNEYDMYADVERKVLEARKDVDLRASL